jgi:hypothetical protein
MTSRGIALIKNVLFTHGHKKNLFSVSVVTDQDMDVKFGKISCIVINIKDNKVICNGVIYGGLYILIVGIVEHKAFLHDNGSLVELWHRRFGHINLDIIKKVQKMVRGIP